MCGNDGLKQLLAVYICHCNVTTTQYMRNLIKDMCANDGLKQLLAVYICHCNVTTTQYMRNLIKF